MALAKKRTSKKQESQELIDFEEEEEEEEVDNELTLDDLLDGSSSMDSNNNRDKSSNSSGSNKPKTPYKHIPHCLKPPEVVEKRNARERKRVRAVNEAFYKLRACVPIENRNKRVSKVKTLQRAIDYIRKLEIILESDEPIDSDAAASLLNQANQLQRNHQQQQQPRKSKQQQNKSNKSSRGANNGKLSKTSKANSTKIEHNLPHINSIVQPTTTLSIQELYENNNQLTTSQQESSYLIEQTAPLATVYQEPPPPPPMQPLLHQSIAYSNHYQLPVKQQQQQQQAHSLVQYGQLDYNLHEQQPDSFHEYPQASNLQVASSSYPNQFEATTNMDLHNRPWTKHATQTRSEPNYSTPSPNEQQAKQQLESPLKSMTSSSLSDQNQINKQATATATATATCGASPLSTSTNASSCSPRVDSTTSLQTAGSHSKLQPPRATKLQENSPLQIQPDSSSSSVLQTNNSMHITTMQKNIGSRANQMNSICHSTAANGLGQQSMAINGGLASNLLENVQQPALVELHEYSLSSEYVNSNQLHHYPGVCVHNDVNSNITYYQSNQNHYHHNQQQQHSHHNYYVNDHQMHQQQQQQQQQTSQSNSILYMDEPVQWQLENKIQLRSNDNGDNSAIQQETFQTQLAPRSGTRTNQQHQQQTTPRPLESNLMLLGDQQQHNNGSNSHQYYPNELHHNNNNNNNNHHHQHQHSFQTTSDQHQFQSQITTATATLNLNDYCANNNNNISSRLHPPAII